MRKLRYIGLLLMLLLTAFPLTAATPSTEGTEFWVTFLKNYDSSVECTLIASAREDATVTVENPKNNWKSTFSVKAGQVSNFSLPIAQCYMSSEETVESKGIKVTSTALISLYASNFEDYTYDASIVLPITALGTDYIVQVFENELFPKEFGIVATHNNTQVTITPHARTTKGRVKNASFTITLNEGETYQVMSSDGGSDFSGSRVQSNYPVAVYAGHVCINVPTGNPWCDHIVEQQMPTPMWGKQFVLTKTSSMVGDRIMLTAKENNTVVKQNGSVLTTLNALESYSFRLTDNSAFIETSEPTACYLYIEGAHDNGMNGDPSSVHISPTEQRIKELTFATFQTRVSRTHYVNIVTTAAGAKSMTLDGQNISAQFSAVSGNSEYRYAQIHISHGTHTLRNDVDGFIGHVYGLGDCESYAYTFGSATLNLDGSILVDGEPHADIVYTDERCYKAAIEFAARSNIEYTSIHWDLGDGTKSDKPTVTHTYAKPGTYTITMAIANEESNDTARTTLTLYDVLHDTIHVDICEGETYTIAGHSYTKDGQYPVKLTSKAGCDSMLLVDLTVNKKKHTVVEAEFYKGSAYRWGDQWYKTAGTYTRTFETSKGCDSIVELHLVQTDPTQITYDTICWQEYYPFHGYDFPLPPIEQFKDKEYLDYTLSYTDKKLCITYRTHLSIVPKEGGSYTVYDTIQSGHAYEWLGEKYTEEGTYHRIMGGGSECKQEYTLHLKVLPFPVDVTEKTLCHEDQITWRDKTYDKPGTYNDTLWTMLGIEGVYRLILTDSRSFVEIIANNVPSYEFKGETLTKSGTYRDTLKNEAGCDSIVTLYLGIHEPCEIQTEMNMSLCEGESYKWGSVTCEPGNDYERKFTSIHGCDSIVTLHVAKLEKKQTTVAVEICEGDFYRMSDVKYTKAGEYTIPLKASNGCDSIVTLQISHKKSYSDTLPVTITIGDSYKWQGETYRKEGIYTKGFVRKNGCDSLKVLALTVNRDCQQLRDTTAEICYGTSLKWHGKTYSESGDYEHLLQFDDRCDTLLKLHLTVLPKVEDSHDSQFIITGNSYHWNGKDYTETGDYKYETKNSHGCDSTAYLHLTVSDKPFKDSTETTSKCSGETFFWQGEYRTPTESNNTFKAKIVGEETDTVITLKVTVHPVFPKVDDTKYICKGATYTWEDDTYTAEGDYKKTLHTVHGCDSVVTLHLRHHPTYDVVDKQYICEGEKYNWEGEDYTVSGDYKKKLQTVHGCDSTVTLRLTVNKKYNVTDEAVEVCYGKSFVWNGVTYTASGTYTQELKSTAGCDSIVTRTITVLPESKSEKEEYIFKGESYKWNGVDYDETGDYLYKTTDSHGCDSTAWLHLIVTDKPFKDSAETTVKCSGETFFWQGENHTPTESNNIFKHRIWGEEVDTIITLTVTVHPTYPNVEETKYICKGETYKWNGTPYTAEGDYKFETKTVHGCDSIVTLHLRHRPVYDDVIDNQSICEGEKYRWEGEDYTVSGDYKKKLQTVHGCDSTVTLRLTVNKKYNLTDEAVEVCYGKSFVWNGVPYSTSGTYTQNLTSAAGCDSIVTRTITVLDESKSDSSVHIFTGETFHWNGKDYTVTGDYSYITPDSHNCDSTAWLHLSVTDKPVYDSTETTVKCSGETFFWQGENRTPTESNNIFEKRLWGAESDTLITLIVTVHPVYPKVDDPQYICEGDTYTWEGDVYSDEGDYTKNLQTIHGCDSIVTLHLRISPVYDGIIDKQSICEGEKYHWEGEDYTVSGNYTKTLHTVYGCDSIVTLILDVWPTFTEEVTDTILTGETYTIDGRTFSASGDYTIPHTTQHGCDSTVILHLTANSVSISDIQSNALCANEATIEIFVTYTGDIHEAHITFTPEAKAAGWRDTVVVIGADGTIRLPNIGRAGIHHGTIELLFRGRLAASGKIVLSLLYPSSVLEQAWNDVVAVLAHNYNGGYDFVAFQWYENGVELVGETRSYLYKPLIMGGEYSALLTEQNGTQQMTCPIIAKLQEDLSLYPTVAAPRQQIHCNVPEQGELVLYDPMGKRVVQMKLTIGDNTFVAPAESGIYATQVVLQGSNNTKTYKLIVR